MLAMRRFASCKSAITRIILLRSMGGTSSQAIHCFSTMPIISWASGGNGGSSGSTPAAFCAQRRFIASGPDSNSGVSAAGTAAGTSGSAAMASGTSTSTAGASPAGATTPAPASGAGGAPCSCCKIAGSTASPSDSSAWMSSRVGGTPSSAMALYSSMDMPGYSVPAGWACCGSAIYLTLHPPGRASSFRKR